jgi:hypothetical protein
MLLRGDIEPRANGFGYGRAREGDVFADLRG